MNFQKIKFWASAMIPYGMTFGSLCMILIVGINGVPGNFMGSIIKIDVTNMQIPPTEMFDLTGLLVTGTDNITYSSVDELDPKYSLYIWNYASTPEGGKETFYDKGFDWVNKLNLDTITVNGVTSDLPSKLSDMVSGFRNKIRFSEYIFLAALFNAAFVLAIGILACFGIKFRLMIVGFFTAITFILMLVFAALITAAGLGTNGDLDRFKKFGLKSETGVSDLGVVWLAVVHMLVVGILWILMAFGVMKMNPSIKNAISRYDEELLSAHPSPGNGHPDMEIK